MEYHHNFFVVTGGPGSGKTTLLQALQAKGYKTMPEAGRAIIKQQTAINGDALPQKNPTLFAKAMMEWDLKNYQRAKAYQENVFFDRGLPDSIGYLTLNALPIPEIMQNAAREYRYNTHVFLAPFWAEIYQTDNERHQSLIEAKQTANMMEDIYQSLGYLIIKLPKASVKERIAFIKNNIITIKQ